MTLFGGALQAFLDLSLSRLWVFHLVLFLDRLPHFRFLRWFRFFHSTIKL